MAKRKTGKLSKAEIKAAGGNLKQAWARRKAKALSKKAHWGRKGGRNRGLKLGARRSAARSTKKSAVRARARKRHTKVPAAAKTTRRRTAKRSSGKRKSPKRVAAGKKAARTRKRRKAERKAGRKTTRRSKARKTTTRRRRSSGRRRARRTRTRSAVSIKLPRRRKRSRGTRVTVKVGKRSRSFRAPRKSRRVYAIAGERRRRGAMENPMDGTELFIGMICGLAGFVGVDVLDRYIATHALVDKNAKDASGNELYADNPPTTGDYAGLYNATAICAPMNAPRWAWGLGFAGLPLVAAHFIQAKNVRAGLQFFGFAAGVRIVGKALTDLIATTLQSNPIGQQLYDGEMRAAVLAANKGNSAAPQLASLPSAGLGRPQLGAAKAPCAPCAASAGAAGAGYPSMPREVAPPAAAQAPVPQVPAAPPKAPPPPPVANQSTNGFTGTNGAPRRVFNPYKWGASDE